VECSDIVLINKVDLLENPGDVELVRKVINSINPKARVLTCTRGEVEDPLTLIGSAGAVGAVNWGILDEHRNLVSAVEKAEKEKDEKDEKDEEEKSHSHSSHSHDHSEEVKEVEASTSASADCADPVCNDPTHSHNHRHNHGEEAVDCADPVCTDPTHDHDHKAHTHGSETSDCADPVCTDPTHNHDHSTHTHSHSTTATTAENRFGITSFVYKRRRPFHPIRFSQFLQGMGQLSVKGVGEMGLSKGKAAVPKSAALIQAKRALLRSKGFVWMGTSGAAAYFMSHAGQYLELLVLGRWWADIPEAEWPAEVLGEITQDFDTHGTHGDRRQELVFIGQFSGSGGSEGQSQRALEEVLDSCLLDDEEFKEYERTVVSGDDALRELFVPDF
jgi:G3E family GTPase